MHYSNKLIVLCEVLYLTNLSTTSRMSENSIFNRAQWAGTAEYTDCVSAKGENSPNECPGYDTKQSDSDASVML